MPMKSNSADRHISVEHKRLDRNFDQDSVSLRESDIIGDSASLQEALRQAEAVAPTDCTVLIAGETGTGKELFARMIHDLSTRKHRTLIKVNCTAIPAGLIESELFGCERGAFTGAVTQRIGSADKGTLFLDEVRGPTSGTAT